MSSRHFVLVLLLPISLVPCSSDGEQAVVEKITVIGNDAFSNREIISWMETKVGSSFNDSTLVRDINRITQRYTENGYWEASVQPAVEGRSSSEVDRSSESAEDGASGEVKLTITIVEGRRTTVGKIVFEGLKAFQEEEIRHLFGMRQGDVPTQRMIEQSIERILTFYEEHGYPFCAVRPPAFALRDSNHVDLTLTIVEGPEVRIDAIEVSGNRTTRREVITREIGIQPGTLYDQRRIDDGYRRLSRSGLFRRIAPPDIRYDTQRERFVLVAGVEEGDTGRMDGVVGYAPAGSGQRGILTGSIDLALGNLLGTGRRLALTWGRVGPVSSDLTVGYREPWVAGAPLSVEGKLQQTERRGYTRTDLDGRAETPISSRLTGYLTIAWTSVIPDSVEQMYSGKSRTKRLGVGMTYDTRDDVIVPRQGRFVSVAAQFGTRRGEAPVRKGGGISNRIGRYEAHIEELIPIFQQHILFIGFHGVGIIASEALLPFSEKLRFGGATTLRGYREEEFTGLRTLWGTGEYRYRFSDGSRVFAFADVGQIYDRRRGIGDSIEAVTLRRIGYGAGVRLDSQAGIIGIDYGLGKGDGFTQGKLHVRLVNRF